MAAAGWGITGSTRYFELEFSLSMGPGTYWDKNYENDSGRLGALAVRPIRTTGGGGRRAAVSPNKAHAFRSQISTRKPF